MILTKKSGISTISIKDGGFEYKVGDDVVFLNAPNVNSSVKEVLGKILYQLHLLKLQITILYFHF